MTKDETSESTQELQMSSDNDAVLAGFALMHTRPETVRAAH